MAEQVLAAEKTKLDGASAKRKGAATGADEGLQDEEEAEDAPQNAVVAPGMASAGASGSAAAFSQLLSFMQAQGSIPAGFGQALQPSVPPETPETAAKARAKQSAKKPKLDQKRSSEEARAAEKSRVAATKAAVKAAAKAERDALKQQATDKKAAAQTVSLAAKTQIMLVSLHDTLTQCDLKDCPEPIAEPLRTLRDRMAEMLQQANTAMNQAKKKGEVIEALGYDAAEVAKAVADSKLVSKKYEQFKALMG